MSAIETPIKIRPQYGAINAARDIAEAWINQWGGDEWGESMSCLHGASHTSYGIADEDCAKLSEMLWGYLVGMKHWVDSEGEGYGMMEGVEHTYEQARESREYWLGGGNLGSWGTTADDAKSVIEQLPAWVFGDE